jgi:hypothetical protein
MRTSGPVVGLGAPGFSSHGEGRGETYETEIETGTEIETEKAERER